MTSYSLNRTVCASAVTVCRVYTARKEASDRERKLWCLSLFHRAFFNSIMYKTPTHALFYSTLY